MAVMSLMGDLGAKAENVIVAQFVRLGVAERVRRLSLLHEEMLATEKEKSAKEEKKEESESSAQKNETEREDVVFPTEKDVSPNSVITNYNKCSRAIII